jgi:hypothetical protein
MCHSDRKGGGSFGESNLWKGNEGKKIVLSQLEFRVPRISKSVQEGRFHEGKEIAIIKMMGSTCPTQHHLSADHTLQQHCCQNSNLIFTVQIKNCREF